MIACVIYATKKFTGSYLSGRKWKLLICHQPKFWCILCHCRWVFFLIALKDSWKAQNTPQNNFFLMNFLCQRQNNITEYYLNITCSKEMTLLWSTHVNGDGARQGGPAQQMPHRKTRPPLLRPLHTRPLLSLGTRDRNTARQARQGPRPGVRDGGRAVHVCGRRILKTLA
jgi:hypothetical protein